jgi:hypothetical protein
VKGTRDADGSNVSVVAEVRAHEPGAAGEMVGMGLPAARGWVSFTCIGPAGDTPVSPAIGEVEEIASTTVWVPPESEVVLDPGPPVAALDEGW